MTTKRSCSADEVIDWLEGLSPDRIVYYGFDTDRCVVGTYATEELGLPSVQMGIDRIYHSPAYPGGVRNEEVRLDPPLPTLVVAWDVEAMHHNGVGLTAAEALAVVRRLTEGKGGNDASRDAGGVLAQDGPEPGLGVGVAGPISLAHS